MRVLWLAALGGLLQRATTATTPSSSPPVNVWLRTSWNATNLLAEIIETASLEDPDAFFPLLNVLTDPSIFMTPLLTEPPQEIYKWGFVALMEHKLLSYAALQSYERALALRSALPKIEAFHAYYEQHVADAPKCGSWVDWYGEKLCSPDEVLAAAGYSCPAWVVSKEHRTCGQEPVLKEDHKDASSLKTPASLSFDHVYPPNADPSSKTAILYGSLGSSNFHSLNTVLYKLASLKTHPIRYVFRHVPDATAGRAFLSGYGVALDLKKTDYLALDDRRSKQKVALGSEQVVLSDEAKDLPVEEDPILAMLPEVDTPIDGSKALTEEEMAALGFKTSQLILDSPNPLSTLRQVTQNFPKYASAISHRVNYTEETILALGGNMQRIGSGASMVWLNGKPISGSDMNPFALLRLMREERKLISQLVSVGLTPAQAVDVLTHPALSKPSVAQVLEAMFDASDRQEGGELIVWLNDLEKDSRYSRWSSSLSTLMQPTYGGGAPPLKRNIHNVIVALDLSQAASVATINVMTGIVQRGFPIRFGIVPIVESDEAIKVAKVFYYLAENFEPLQAVGMYTKAADPRRPTIEIDNLARVYASVASTEEPLHGPWKDFDEITSSWDADKVLRLGRYCERLGLTSESSKGGHVFVNGKYYGLTEDWLRPLQTEIAQQTQFLQEAIYNGELEDSEELDMSVWFYDLPTTASSRNGYIYPSSSGPSALKIVPLVDLPLPDRFVYPPGAESVPLSMWIVGDLETDNAVAIVREALKAMTASSSFRLSFVHAPHTSTAGSPQIAPALIDVLLSESSASPSEVLSLLDAMVMEEATAAQEILHKVWGGESRAVTVEQVLELESSGKVVAEKLGFKPGEVGVVVNGRVIGPLQKAFTASDFHTLASYEKNKRVSPVLEALALVLSPSAPEEDPDFRVPDDVLAKVSSIVLADQLPEASMIEATATPRSRPYQLLVAENASFTVGNNETAIFHFGAVLNPMSDAAQRYSSLLEWLSDDRLVHAVVYLNPPHEVKEMPLKRFYRYNLQRRLDFDETSGIADAKVEFTDLPVDPIYTLAMDVPPAWLVRPHESLHDLDNIQLSTLTAEEQKTGVEAVFSLDYLVVEGHARDTVTKSPPRGLQLQLTSNDVPIADTQVVANLGYFQLKAKPGVFQLEIRLGRGRDIFEMTSAGNEGWGSPSVEEAGVDVTVTSFEGVTLYPVFQRKEGQENADVLEDVEEDAGFFGNLASKVGSVFGTAAPKTTTEVTKRQADINIFTVASGLLYERFASIMILSVLKNTDKSVKFWFIENFLSPSFLEFIPHFAEEYGFEYELVTYKWPSWLRMPTEKQRIIWGYKILFLDVLFPMDLKKVIFVDADQIVRADLHELITLDMQGAPYGYTPMGDDSIDMDGFRFWKTGYWKEHLRGRPYHISALYVVDLVRFRQLAAGDRLRGQYQGLSADPGSLANLDQDLPNNMQREVPIFSLHEDWLWCETWCSKDRLHRAKTIDLCQNPKTKEPKLSRARQIPEWEKYDSEIATFARKLANAGKIRSSAAAENVDALAGVTKAAPAPEHTEDAKETEPIRDEL